MDEPSPRAWWELGRFLHPPAAINAAQFLANLATGAAGVMAMAGGMPFLLTAQIGALLAVGVGALLFVGGTLGAGAVLSGTWWLERVALLIVAVGWVALLPATVGFAHSGRSPGAAWLVVALLAVALSDVFKRYNRISWAYLDPTR